MPSVEFVDSDADCVLVEEVPSGGALIDICDAAAAPVAFSCRSATCGTCQIEVEEGARHLEPPGEEEQELLEMLESSERTRLACQAKVRPGVGRLRVRPVGT